MYKINPKRGLESLKKIFSRRSKFFLLVPVTIAILVAGMFLVKPNVLPKLNAAPSREDTVKSEIIKPVLPSDQNVVGLDEKVAKEEPKQTTAKKIKVVPAPTVKSIKKTTTPINSVVSPPVASVSSSASTILSLVNEARRANSLSSVSYNSKLSQAAQAKADDMSSQNYFSHTNPQGQNDFYFATSAGYKYSWIGSNIAKGSYSSAQGVFDAWMNSPGHKANILGAKGLEIGYAQNGQYFSFFIGAAQ
ncbi:TPA: CAP domain-containing protein [Candidatus Berkelbacteria bacterium]|uniref:SCP domain-containing protein n=1 Tax=Berkelbacteria bacterium GW2011_GWE1_39_12 TaxID=1618337 RepID=A0A0G4B354_9BACT|nr:MAG: hypothetical protein UT28_C0001G0577 [Berkelbacteria bacterium GW2011_GWE1_39_12]HBO60971.1 CAP domain-containing protein [Candidatus Berkelbacteria bacterium]